MPAQHSLLCNRWVVESVLLDGQGGGLTADSFAPTVILPVILRNREAGGQATDILNADGGDQQPPFPEHLSSQACRSAAALTSFKWLTEAQFFEREH